MKTTQHKSAFTLVETIIAITVIGLTITAAAQLTQSSLKVGRSTMNKFISFHLAEEGIEIIRNMRDSNWLQNSAWRKGLEDGTYVIIENSPPWRDGKWTIQRIAPDAQLPNAASAALPERIPFRFARVIEIAGTDKTMKIKSKVLYDEKEVTLKAEFTDWKKGPL